MAAEALMKPFLDPPLCANHDQLVNGETRPCHNVANFACVSCMLVQYCSKECQKMHWRKHKIQCKSDLMQAKYLPQWTRERRAPAFKIDDIARTRIGKRRHLWGKLPALDILKMKNNEGLGDLARDVSLLFADSGDCRNVVKTIVDLPENFTGRCTVVINDSDPVVVGRNLIIILCALHLEPAVATPIMIHLWYSALIPAVMLEILQKEILPHIAHVCDEIVDPPDDSIVEKTFIFSKGSLRLRLKKYKWLWLPFLFNRSGITRESATSIRAETTLDPLLVDWRDRLMYSYPPGRRAGSMDFRATGILRPFGCSVTDFDTPNPTFFLKELEAWPIDPDGDPLHGWLDHDYLPFAPAAKADVYGSLFFYLRDVFLKFCHRVQNKNIDFQLHNENPSNLPEILTQEGITFDRIEIAEGCDRVHMGPANTISTFAPLLQPKSKNPRATLLMTLYYAISEMIVKSGWKRRIDAFSGRIESVCSVVPENVRKGILLRCQLDAENTAYHPESHQIYGFASMFHDVDEMFSEYMNDTRMLPRAWNVGCRIKHRHSIVKKWPYRVTKMSTMKDLERLFGMGSDAGNERFVELERIE